MYKIINKQTNEKQRNNVQINVCVFSGPKVNTKTTQKQFTLQMDYIWIFG